MLRQQSTGTHRYRRLGRAVTDVLFRALFSALVPRLRVCTIRGSERQYDNTEE
jgi:hypothetical protein